VEERKTRLHAGLTGIVTSLLLCAVYIFFRTVPFFNIYMGADRRRYFLVVFILSLCGIFIFLAAKGRVKGWRLKVPMYIISFIFVIGIPVIILIGYGTSARGWEWALTTFLIALPPILFIMLGFFILSGYRVFSLVLFIIFSSLVLYNLFLAVKLSGLAGKEFGTLSIPALLVTLGIIVMKIIFALLNLRHFRSA
jgi:hypothetical protein